MCIKEKKLRVTANFSENLCKPKTREQYIFCKFHFSITIYIKYYFILVYKETIFSGIESNNKNKNCQT